MADSSSSGRRKRWFLPLFIVFILVSSAFGVFIGGFNSSPSPTSTVTVGNTEFSQQSDGRWTGTANGVSLTLSSPPAELSPFVSSVSFDAFSSAQKLYLSVDPSNSPYLALNDVYATLRNSPLPSVVLACSIEGPGCENLPIKTCLDAGSGVIVLSFASNNETTSTVNYTDGCYIFSGNSEALLQAADAFLLQLFGVI